MENISTLKNETINVHPEKKRIMGLYVSTDGNIEGEDPSRYVKGTMDDCKLLLTKNKNK